MLMQIFLGLTALSAGVILKPKAVNAHCDTFEGPVIKTAIRALEEGSVNPVLKWIRAEDEEEVRKSFDLAMKVRTHGPDSQEVADKSFFETLVRLHRAGEGVGFTGIKPGSCIPEVIVKADEVLETGDVSALAEEISAHVEKSVKERFEKAIEEKKTAEESPEKGREYVEAYISFVHYIEGIHSLTVGAVHHHE